jgi:hypothetical protein
MFYMPGTKMLFGDAKTTCDGKHDPQIVFSGFILADQSPAAIKHALEEKHKAAMFV